MAEIPNASFRSVKDVIQETEKIFFGSRRRSHIPTPAQMAFKNKLFAISTERQTKRIEDCQDVNAHAFLSEQEYNALIAEAKSLK